MKYHLVQEENKIAHSNKLKKIFKTVPSEALADTFTSFDKIRKGY
jgi:hypothetical protein